MSSQQTNERTKHHHPIQIPLGAFAAEQQIVRPRARLGAAG
jgi:hypothetical protein